MTQKTSMPRYYIRDDESNDMWCFDAKMYSGKQQTAKVS
jgi:hypothetical protein